MEKGSNICHRRRQPQRPRRQHLATVGMIIHLAIAAAVRSSLAFAFGPSSPSIMPGNHPASATAMCGGRRKDALIMGAKKPRRPASGDVAGKDDNCRGSEEEYGNRRDDGSDENDASETEGVPKQTTLSGGPSLIFDMARRMLVWDDEMYESGMLNDAGSREGADEAPPSSILPTKQYLSTLTSSPSSPPPLPPSIPTNSSTSQLPRWRPTAIRRQSISNINPAFRTSSPIMTSAGYAGILRRNSRKKNKPSMWRHTLRVYSKMEELENEYEASSGVNAATVGAKNEGGIPGVGSNRSPAMAKPSGTKRKRIRLGTAHHEAALVAASKLGMWEEAIRIYRGVESSVLNGAASESLSNTGGKLRRGRSRITDNMILSVISACVKGSKVKRTASPAYVVSDAANLANATNPTNATGSSSEINDGSNLTYAQRMFFTDAPASERPSPSQPMMRSLTAEERRKPLDLALDIVLTVEGKHDIPLVSRHINPLASAYNRLGLRQEAAALINEHLEDRTPPPPSQRDSPSEKSKHWQEKVELTSENPGFEGVKLVDWREDDLDGNSDDDYDEYADGYEEMQLNIHQMKSKDRASYSLLVQGAAMDRDWTGAVQELQRMTDAGLHPNSRNLNSWNEVMERGCRPSGNGDKDESYDGSSGYYSEWRQRRRSWKKKRDGIWLGNLP